MAFEFYSILGVDKTATADEIKRAYRKKAMELHPDRNAGDKSKEAEFKKVNEAYAILSDETKRAQYDRFGGVNHDAGGGGMHGFGGGGVEFDFSDIFESFFQGGGRQQSWRKRQERGEDLEATMKISFEESYRGVKKSLTFDILKVCSICHGSGTKEGSKPASCTTCGGHWQVRRRVDTFFGTVEQMTTCPTCGGQGSIIKDVCSLCRGNKRVKETIAKDIDVPAGIENSMTIKLREEGNEGVSGKQGDLYIVFRVPSKEGNLSREWNDMIYTLDIDPVEAIIGIEKNVNLGFLGERKLSIPKGSQHKDMIRFKNEGFPSVSTQKKWDLIIVINIIIPKKISTKEQELFEQILRERGVKKGKTGGFLSGFFE